MSQNSESLNSKSQVVTQGDRRAPNRAMLRAVGFSDEDFQKPIVGVANGQSDITPCNAGVGKLADIAANQSEKKGECLKHLAPSPSAMEFLWGQKV